MLKIKDIKEFKDYTIDTEGNVYSKRKTAGGFIWHFV